MRDATERPEGVAAGTAILTGPNACAIVKHAARLLTDETAYCHGHRQESLRGRSRRRADRGAGSAATSQTETLEPLSSPGLGEPEREAQELLSMSFASYRHN